MNDAVQARDPAASRAAVEAHLSYVEQAFIDQMRAEKHESIARRKLEQEASR
jgi:GntR family transcriptional repressor for pyruvate dehydrogenase complex